MRTHRAVFALGLVAVVFTLVGASLGAFTGEHRAAAAPAQAPLQQGVTASGIVTTGSGTCFPDAVLIDCNGNVTHQLKGPGGAGFFTPYLNRWVDVNGSQQNCTAGDPYLQVVTIQPANNPCGGGGQPTMPPPPGATATLVPPPGPTVTPGGPTNLATGRPVVASSSQPGFPPEYAVDGNTASYWASNPGRYPSYAQNQQWIYVDLGSPQRMEQMRIHWNAQRFARSYGIYMWHDSCRGWCYLGSTTNANGGEDTWTARGHIEGQYFMLWLVNPYLGGNGYEILEWEIFGPGSVPVQGTNVALNKPATAFSQAPGFEAGMSTDGNLATEWHSAGGIPTWVYVDLGTATDVDRVILRWSAGLHATRYVLYAWDDRTIPGRWVAVYNRTNGAGGDETATFWRTRTRYMMLYATAGAGTEIGLRELEVYNYVAGAPPGPPGLPPPPVPFMQYQDPRGSGITGSSPTETRQRFETLGRPSIVPEGIEARTPAEIQRDLAATFGIRGGQGADGVALPNLGGAVRPDVMENARD
jgi:hypothetical protein